MLTRVQQRAECSEHFSDEFITELELFLLERDGAEVDVSHTHTAFREDLELFDEEEFTHVFMRVFNNTTLIMKVVSLHHQRQGVFTDLVGLLYNHFSDTSVQTFMVESVTTEAMHRWVTKNGLRMAPNGVPVCGGLGVDYICPLQSLHDLQ